MRVGRPSRTFAQRETWVGRTYRAEAPGWDSWDGAGICTRKGSRGLVGGGGGGGAADEVQLRGGGFRGRRGEIEHFQGQLEPQGELGGPRHIQGMAGNRLAVA